MVENRKTMAGHSLAINLFSEHIERLELEITAFRQAVETLRKVDAASKEESPKPELGGANQRTELALSKTEYDPHMAASISSLDSPPSSTLTDETTAKTSITK